MTPRQVVIEAIKEQLYLESVTSESLRIVEDLGADSLDVVELVMEIELQLDIILEDEEVLKVSTVGEAIALVESKVTK